MSTITIPIFDDNDVEHDVEVEYTAAPYRPATNWEPAEGGVEVHRVDCTTHHLTVKEIDYATTRAQEIVSERMRTGDI